MFSITPFLETERLILSPIDEGNIENYFLFLNNQQNDVFTEHAEFPHSKESIVKHIKNKNNSETSIFLGIYLNDKTQHIGNIELSNIDLIHRTAEYKILVDNAYAKSGYATEASTILLEHAFAKLNLYKIYLGVSEDNSPAIALYEKLGFEREGVMVGQLLKNNQRVNIINMAIFTKLL